MCICLVNCIQLVLMKHFFFFIFFILHVLELYMARKSLIKDSLPELTYIENCVFALLVFSPVGGFFLVANRIYYKSSCLYGNIYC